MNSRELIAAESPNRIRDHLGRKARYNPTLSLTSLTNQLSLEYEDRFLVELVQNAYDAHPPGTHDGRVHVLLRESDDGGSVLYVANTGNPFNSSNFDALTNVAQSSKPPGEGIGNKGVGFRSVLQVCDSPEIYSCDPLTLSGPDFGGFCFGFASDAQIKEMAPNERDFETVKRDFSRYLLPVIAEASDPNLGVLRALGMVTVVRLPLTTARAVELARTQLKRLMEPSPPIALFLDRLESITVEHIESDGSQATAKIERQVTEIGSGPTQPTLRWVETAGRRFLVTTRLMTAATVRSVVSDAVELGELDPSWLAWDSDVEVSLAVQTGDGDGGNDRRATYTYLPMHAASPVHAHLHAPFHTKLARLNLREDSVFNSFLIRTAADLAAETIELFSNGEPVDIDEHTRRTATVDLMCWDTDHIEQLETALKKRGLNLTQSPIIPARDRTGATWAPASHVRLWSVAELEILNSGAIETHVQLVDGSLGTDRVRRLKYLCEQVLSCDLEPDDGQVADWVERVAAGLDGASLTTWNRFLNDVAAIFASRNQGALQGKRILLDDKGRIRRSGPWFNAGSGPPEPTVFFPPTSSGSLGGDTADDAELSTVPKNLQRAIAFLHEDIKVRTRVGSTYRRTAVGELFRKADLVEPFELAAVLNHLERLLAGNVSITTYRQALSWVYAQERASRSNIADLARLGLRVPTELGWVPANQAVFSRGWGTAHASIVASLVELAGGTSRSIQALGDYAIQQPSDWPFKLKDLDSFRDFMTRCGVRDGLFPVALRSKTAIRMNGNNFNPATIAGRFGLASYEDWAQHIKQTWSPYYVAHPNTPYTGGQQLWVVPGQDAFSSLPSSAKDRLAGAILDTIAEWPDESWTYEFRRRSSHHVSKPDPQQWPSPARTFVERAEWIPMSDAGRRDERYFVSVAKAWTFDETTSEAAPRFARLIPIEHRRRLADSSAARERLRKAGLRTWNSPASSGARLAELSDLLASGEASEYEFLSIRRAASRAWSEFIRLPARALPDGLRLVVTRGSVLEVLTPSASEPPEIFVHDTPPGLVAQVLEAGGFPLLVADPADGKGIADVLATKSEILVRRTSTVEAKVVLDGKELTPSATVGDGFLDVFDRWLVRVLLAIIDLRSTRFARVTDKVLHDVEARIRRVRLALGGNIQVNVDEQVLPATGRLAESVHLDDPDDPLLILNQQELVVPSWRALEVLADDLAELIGQGQVASEIRAAALGFQRLVNDWREPTDHEIARVLRCEVSAVADVLQNLRTSSEHLRLLLSPFVGVLAGTQFARRFESETVADLSELNVLLADIVGADAAASLFACAQRADSIDEIRRETGTDLGALNKVLLELGRQPIHFGELHRAALESYVNEHRLKLLEVLRRRFLAQFENLGDLSRYVAARDFRSVSPDPRWLDAHEEPTEAMMQELMNNWVAARGQQPSTVKLLDSVDDVRQANRTLLDSRLPQIARLIVAWLNKSGSEIPDLWIELQGVRDALGTSGCLDFKVLDERQILAWLATLNLWPTGMKLTLSPSELGLTETDLEAARSSKAVSDERKRRRRTELSFGQKTFDTASEELGDLVLAVAESVDNNFLQTRPNPKNLVAVNFPSGGTSKSTSGSRLAPRSYGGPKLSQEQTAAIGLIGEVLAYKWLQRTYRETTPDSWVSANRTFQLGGHQGNDGLGYDFRIARKNETLFFEVKATRTDVYEFDIGESELRAARAARKGWYRIIFIRSILTPTERELLVLPNPLESDAIASYKQINQGMRLRFDPHGSA